MIFNCNSNFKCCHSMCKRDWSGSWRFSCLVSWFCYHSIAKPANKTAAPPWPVPDYGPDIMFRFQGLSSASMSSGRSRWWWTKGIPHACLCIYHYQVQENAQYGTGGSQKGSTLSLSMMNCFQETKMCLQCVSSFVPELVLYGKH